jgi:putative ABC transport system permease protein
MLKNYIKIAFRNLIKQKTTSFINILGLSIGLTCCFLINQYVQFELSYDKFQKNYDNIYEIRTGYKNESSIIEYINMVNINLCNYFKLNFPQFKNFIYFIDASNIITYKDKQFIEDGIQFVDPEIFDMFSFDFIKGDPQNALKQPNSVTLDEELAIKYFENDDPLGKNITIGNMDLTVTGIFRKYPGNSNIRPKILISSLSDKRRSFVKGSNLSITGEIFVQLNPNISPIDFGNLLTKSGMEFSGYSKEDSDSYKIDLQPLSRVHLYTLADYSLEEEGQGDIKSIYIYSIIAFFILIIAIINFINISIGQLSSRYKEVGLRKVLGAEKRNILLQFFLEIMLLCLISAIISIIFVSLLLPGFNILTNREIALNFNMNMILSVIAIYMVTCIFAGLLPSILFSRLQPLETLRGKTITGQTWKLSYILIFIQFTLAILFVICSNIMTRQLDFMMLENKVPINDKIIQIRTRPLYRIYNEEEIKNKCTTFLKNISQNQMIQITSEELGGMMGSKVNCDGKIFKCTYNLIKENYFNMYGIKIKEGRDLNYNLYPNDIKNSIIINETFVKENNIKNPIGLVLRDEYSKESRQIIGIVEDFNLGSIKDKIPPMSYIYSTFKSARLCIKFSENNISNALPFIKEKWKEYFPEAIIDYTFYDDSWRERYKTELNSQKLIIIVSVISLLLSIFGVIGVATMSMSKRTKEIGIRKVLGASVGKIILILLKNYILLVIISAVIAIPAAYYYMNKWLQDYVYRVDMTIWTFLFPVLIILAIVLFTVSFKTIKAARANPVESLKYE